ncbi:DUF1801 domain-containing protein [Nonomuraea sp. NPDC059007]
MTVNDYTTKLDQPLREIAEKLQALIDAAMPQAGAVWHGHPVWSLGGAPGKTPVAFFKAYKNYVTFGLWRGQEIEDPSGRLTAANRQMAVVKLQGVEEIDDELFASWIEAARALEA